MSQETIGTIVLHSLSRLANSVDVGFERRHKQVVFSLKRSQVPEDFDEYAYAFIRWQLILKLGAPLVVRNKFVETGFHKKKS